MAVNDGVAIVADDPDRLDDVLLIVGLGHPMIGKSAVGVGIRVRRKRKHYPDESNRVASHLLMVSFKMGAICSEKTTNLPPINENPSAKIAKNTGREEVVANAIAAVTVTADSAIIRVGVAIVIAVAVRTRIRIEA